MEERYLELARVAERAASLIGNPETKAFMILDARQPAPDAASETARMFAKHHMQYLGIIGLVDRVPRVVLDVPLDADSIALLTRIFVQRVQAETLPRMIAVVENPTDDFVEFMQRMWSLEDTRIPKV